MKVRGMSIYGTSLGRDPGHTAPTAGGMIEHRHRGLGGGGNLRAAVFGVNDGLVSNCEPDPRRRRRELRPARRAADRRRRHVRRCLRDGRRRIRVGALAARALRIPDRARARRARAVSGGRSAGARADLRGEGPAGRGGDEARQPDRRRSRARARHAGARGARAQSRGARLAVGRRDLVVRVVRGGRAAAAHSVLPGGRARTRCRSRSRSPRCRSSRSARSSRSSPDAMRSIPARACCCWARSREASPTRSADWPAWHWGSALADAAQRSGADPQGRAREVAGAQASLDLLGRGRACRRRPGERRHGERPDVGRQVPRARRVFARLADSRPRLDLRPGAIRRRRIPSEPDRRGGRATERPARPAAHRLPTGAWRKRRAPRADRRPVRRHPRRPAVGGGPGGMARGDLRRARGPSRRRMRLRALRRRGARARRARAAHRRCPRHAAGARDDGRGRRPLRRRRRRAATRRAFTSTSATAAAPCARRRRAARC